MYCRLPLGWPSSSGREAVNLCMKLQQQRLAALLLQQQTMMQH
jgi:hypothetical protein